MTMPRNSETSEADTNQPMVFAPIRPSEEVAPIWVMPTMSVESTSGAMIILMRRRKRSVTSEMYPAIAASVCRIGIRSVTSRSRPRYRAASRSRIKVVKCFGIAYSPPLQGAG